MCQLCDDKLKNIRIALAAKIVGHLPKEDDTGLEEITTSTINEHARMVGAINADDARIIASCPVIKEKMMAGIRKALPGISIEDRFRIALAAGVVRL